MSATFITQAQFDDIDACMSYIESIGNVVSEFSSAADVGNEFFYTPPPRQEMRAGETQAKLWRLKTEPGFYRFLSGHIEELALLSRYLNAYVAGLSPAEKRGLVSTLSNIRFPPTLYPAFGSEAISDCLSLLQYHQKWVRAFAELFRAADSGYEAVRKTIHSVLPRVLDFMAVHMQTANGRNPAPVRLNAARRHAHEVHRQYCAGMGATANFLTQYQRVSTLVTQADQRFGELDTLATLGRLDTHMTLMMVDLHQVHRLSGEIIALRAGG